MSIRVVVPVPPEMEADPAEPAARGKQADGPRTLGIVDNGKHNARALLTMLGERLVKAGVADELDVYTKPAPGRVIPQEPRAQMAARARLVITGVGD
jgi:hypothetical protein